MIIKKFTDLYSANPRKTFLKISFNANNGVDVKHYSLKLIFIQLKLYNLGKKYQQLFTKNETSVNQWKTILRLNNNNKELFYVLLQKGNGKKTFFNAVVELHATWNYCELCLLMVEIFSWK